MFFNPLFSHDDKLVLKMTKKDNRCNCDSTFKTNYPSVFVRDLSKCIEIESEQLPPSAVDMEYQTNMKLDYLKFVSDNTSR